MELRGVCMFFFPMGDRGNNSNLLIGRLRRWRGRPQSYRQPLSKTQPRGVARAKRCVFDGFALFTQAFSYRRPEIRFKTTPSGRGGTFLLPVVFLLGFRWVSTLCRGYFRPGIGDTSIALPRWGSTLDLCFPWVSALCGGFFWRR